MVLGCKISSFLMTCLVYVLQLCDLVVESVEKLISDGV